MSEYKNNHFVPRSYLKRFSSDATKKTIGLYNLRRQQVKERAPIKTQCSRDYFYSKNPKFEKTFTAVEGQQKNLIDSILTTKSVPKPSTDDRKSLSFGLIFQTSRTASAAKHHDHIFNQLSKAMLQHHLTQEGNHALLQHLPDVQFRQENAVLEVMAETAALYPLLNDLDCTLFLNESPEDFLTSDHPVALCSALPGADPSRRLTGYASRGLIVLYPLTPRVLLFLSDAEAYSVRRTAAGVSTIYSSREVETLNLVQCHQAEQNVYFADKGRVASTLQRFENRRAYLRPDPPNIVERPVHRDGRSGVELELPPSNLRFVLPRSVDLRHAIKTGRFKLGDAFVRDPLRVAIVRAETDSVYKRREEVTRRTTAAKSPDISDAS